ncbi:MAG: hypothetical protein M3O35_22110 [Acidobacteriota bacterium]|nr:hypothetical protein [Acidobacteriota bacterium]
MRCLYCGKELALLKRLRGNGEFCSDSHKQSYQEEYNRLALSRLLQAQSRSEEVRTEVSAADAAAAEAPPVEVPEVETDELEVFPAETSVVEESPVEESVVEMAAEPEPEPEPIEEVEPDPPSASFVSDSSKIQNVAFASLVSEGPVDLTSQPLLPAAELSAERYEIETPPGEAGLVALPVHARLRAGAILSPEVRGLNAREFRAPSFAMRAELSHESPRGFSSCGVVPFPVDALTPPAPVSWDYTRKPAFTSVPAFEQSMLLDFGNGGPELPAADGAAVTITDTAALGPVAEWTEPESPKLALEALTRMQREIAGAPAPQSPQRNGSHFGELVMDTATLERAFAPKRERTVRPAAAAPDPVRQEIEAPAALAAVMEIPLEIAPPPKVQPYSAFEAVTLTSLAPRLPRVDALPLRPKIFTGGAPDEAGRPAVRQPLSAVRVSVVGAGLQTGAAPAPKPTTPPTPAANVTKAPPSVPRPNRTGPQKPAQPAKAAARTPEAPRKKAPEPAAKPQTAKPKVESTPQLPKQDPAVAAFALKQAAAVGIKEPPAHDVPNLDWSTNAGFLRSAKSKILLVAALLIAIAVVVFFNMGSHKSTAAGAATSDGVGPSIMMGEGGWITDWAGDTRSQSRGRHISMYRPSLTLSDYRIEFQGRIETKSIGWVFRAANPENYYVLKLQQAGPGRLELAKFAVVNGIQRQFSSVQLPAEIHADALVSVRVDVRGSKFATFVKGQPVDVWTENQLKSGGVGFLNDRGERALIQSVQISYLSGAGR